MSFPRSHWPLTIALVLAVVAIATVVAGEDLDLQRDDDLTKTTHELEPVTFDLKLSYVGLQSSVVVEVFLLDEPQDWTHELTAISSAGTVSSEGSVRVTLSWGEAAGVALTVTPGEDCRGGLYVLTVFASVEGEIGLKDTDVVHVAVPDVFAHATRLVDHPPEGARATNGSDALVWVEIENTGNMDDRFEVTATVGEGAGVWSVKLVSGVDVAGVTPTVLHGSSHVVTLAASLRSGSSSWEEGVVVVRVDPVTGPEETATEVEANVSADLGTGLMAEVVGDRILTVDPVDGPEVTAAIRLTNLGPADVLVTASTDVLGPPADLVLEVEPASRSVPAGEVVGFDVIIDAPLDCLSGTYVILVAFSPQGEQGGTWVELGVRVRQQHEVEVDPLERDLVVDLGLTPSFPLEITNGGNGPTLVYIWPFGLPLGWSAFTNPSRLHLQPGEGATSEFFLLLPTTTTPEPRGPIELTFRVEELDGDKEMVTVRVFIPGWFQVEWMGMDGPVTGPDLPVALTNDVTGGGLRHGPGDDGEMDITVRVTNLGPVNASALLSVSCGTEGITALFDEDRAFVPARGIVPLVLHLVIDGGTEAGAHTVELSLSVAESPESENRTAPFTIDVTTVDVEASLYRWEGLFADPDHPGELFATEGVEVTFGFYVRDTGTQRAENVLVRFDHDLPNGTSELVFDWASPSIEGGWKEFTHVWIAGEPGEHRFQVTASADDQANTANDVSRRTLVVLPAGGDNGNGGGGDGGGGGGGDPVPGPEEDPFLPRVSPAGVWLLAVTVAVFACVGLWRYWGRARAP